MGKDLQSAKTETIRPGFSLDDVAKEWLKSKLNVIEKCTQKDVLTICGQISTGVDLRVRMAIEGLQKRKTTLLVILHTNGGIVEEVQNIVQVIRYHYRHVHFLVPVCAMSAGTVLVMSGDKIYMDYFSRLGPIDPQIQTPNGIVPALSYLRQYERLVEKSQRGNLTTAEYALLGKLDLAQLHQLELAADLSVSLIEKWLTDYKFKDWKKNGRPVSEQDKRKRAKDIARNLNDHQRWYTHGHSIHKDILANDLSLQIDDYSTDEETKKAVWTCFWALLEYAGGLSLPTFVHSRGFP